MTFNAQGEILFRRIDKMPEGLSEPTIERTNKGEWIISHSENGNHHVLDAHATVLERPSKGMQVLYALLDEPGKLKQDAPDAHGAHTLEPGIYEMRIKRERELFSEQVRRVAD